jgi:PAS domain S-box-containing protein
MSPHDDAAPAKPEAAATCGTLLKRGSPPPSAKPGDDTKRRIGERRASEKRYRGLMEAAPDAMVVVNQAGDIVVVNLQAEKQFGYPRDELLGQRVTNIIPKGFAERLAADNLRSPEDASAQQIGTGIELIGRRKDSSEFPIELMLSPLESAEGVLVTAAIRNITERKAAEQLLVQMEGRYRGLLEAAPDAMVVVSESGDIVLLNLQAEHQFGYPRDELLGQPIKNIIPEGFAERLIADDARTSVEALAQHIGTGIELSGRRKDGSEFPIEIMLSPLESPEGVLVTAAIRNITERRSTEEQLRQAQKTEAIGNLTGGMAHDFNNLLGVIIGNLDLAKPLFGDNDEVTELLQEATDAALSAAELTRRLLAFARRQPLRPRRIAPNELVSNIVRLLRRTLGENIDIALDLADDLWPVIADAPQLEAALTNLATNARDAMPTGGRLSIVTANRHLDAEYAAAHVEVTPGDYAAIEVTDAGIGMGEELIEHIFDPFFTTKEMGKGTGLGLSMVFGFMKQSGGHINVYSERGKGTTFRLYLPRAAAGPVVPDLVQHTSPKHGAGEIVLVVEDNARLRRVVVRQLRGLGYRPLEASGPEAAFAILERDKVDLLFTDVVMPGSIDGVALAQRTIERWPETKVVLNSGFPATMLDDRFAPRDTAVCLLSKPYRLEELASVLRKALDASEG